MSSYNAWPFPKPDAAASSSSFSSSSSSSVTPAHANLSKLAAQMSASKSAAVVVAVPNGKPTPASKSMREPAATTDQEPPLKKPKPSAAASPAPKPVNGKPKPKPQAETKLPEAKPEPPLPAGFHGVKPRVSSLKAVLEAQRVAAEAKAKAEQMMKEAQAAADAALEAEADQMLVDPEAEEEQETPMAEDTVPATEAEEADIFAQTDKENAAEEEKKTKKQADANGSNKVAMEMQRLRDEAKLKEFAKAEVQKSEKKLRAELAEEEKKVKELERSLQAKREAAAEEEEEDIQLAQADPESPKPKSKTKGRLRKVIRDESDDETVLNVKTLMEQVEDDDEDDDAHARRCADEAEDDVIYQDQIDQFLKITVGETIDYDELDIEDIRCYETDEKKKRSFQQFLKEQRDAEVKRNGNGKKKKSGAKRFVDDSAAEVDDAEAEKEDKATIKKTKGKGKSAKKPAASKARPPKDRDMDEESGGDEEAEEVSNADSTELATREHEEAEKLEGIAPRLLASREVLDGFKCQTGRPVQFRCAACLAPKAPKRPACSECKLSLIAKLQAGEIKESDVKITLRFHPAQVIPNKKVKDAPPRHVDPHHKWHYELVDSRDDRHAPYVLDNTLGMELAVASKALPFKGTSSAEWQNIVTNRNRRLATYDAGTSMAIPIIHPGTFVSKLSAKLKPEMEKFAEEVDRRMVHDLFTITSDSHKDFVPPQLHAVWKEARKSLLPPTKKAQEEKKAAAPKKPKAEEKKPAPIPKAEEKKATVRPVLATPTPTPTPSLTEMDDSAMSDVSVTTEEEEYASAVDEFNAALGSTKKLMQELTRRQVTAMLKQVAPVLSKMNSRKAVHEMRGHYSGADSMTHLSALATALVISEAVLARRLTDKKTPAPVIVDNNDRGEEEEEEEKKPTPALKKRK